LIRERTVLDVTEKVSRPILISEIRIRFPLRFRLPVPYKVRFRRLLSHCAIRLALLAWLAALAASSIVLPIADKAAAGCAYGVLSDDKRIVPALLLVAVGEESGLLPVWPQWLHVIRSSMVPSEVIRVIRIWIIPGSVARHPQQYLFSASSSS
jgi:hypothetical protein